MQVDYSLKTSEERIECVNNILLCTPKEQQTPQYLNYLADYILFVADSAQTKREKKENLPIITKNREVTVKKRQISFEEVVSSLENGEDGLYALITNDKNQILDPREPLTSQDIEECPEIKEQLTLIQNLKKQFDTAKGQQRYALKKQIIETWQQIYILKSSYKGIPAKGKISNQLRTIAHANLDENITFDSNQMPQSNGLVSLFNPIHISFLLCHYAQLKQECVDDLGSDMHFVLLDLEDLTEKALSKDYPLLYDLLIWKIDGLTNEEIIQKMESHYGVTHTAQYYSTLWRKRIPRLIADEASKQYLIWYYTNIEKGNWKKCGSCGEIKLAHPFFFSRNTSKDGFYSICKECRKAILDHNDC